MDQLMEVKQESKYDSFSVNSFYFAYVKSPDIIKEFHVNIVKDIIFQCLRILNVVGIAV